MYPCQILHPDPGHFAESWNVPEAYLPTCLGALVEGTPALRPLSETCAFSRGLHQYFPRTHSKWWHQAQVQKIMSSPAGRCCSTGEGGSSITLPRHQWCLKHQARVTEQPDRAVVPGRKSARTQEVIWKRLYVAVWDIRTSKIMWSWPVAVNEVWIRAEFKTTPAIKPRLNPGWQF